MYSLVQDGMYPAMRTFAQHASRNTEGSVFHKQNVAFWIAVLIAASVLPAAAKIKGKVTLVVSNNIEVTAGLADAVKAVEEVASDPTVYGTYVYERDRTLTGARQVDSSSAFGNDVPEGKVFYKVVDDVLAPRHFRDAEDSGTVTVRYVVRVVNPATVSIRVDAVFIESARRAIHPSEGAVESAEFGQVQQHLNRIQAREKEALEEASEEVRAAAAASGLDKQEVKAADGPAAAEPEPLRAAAKPDPPVAAAQVAAAQVAEPAQSAREEVSSAPLSSTPFSSASLGSVAELEQRVNQLRHQVEARIKAPGAALKSAPFHTATTIQTVPAEAEVAIVILTPYWYGVQTTDGHTGWIQRSQLEPLP